MPLQATSGAASYDGFGGGVAAVPTYIEEVFSTWLYAGTGATQSINNGIDVTGKGALIWLKNRTLTNSNFLLDTARGVGAGTTLSSNTSAAGGSQASIAFTSTGFDLLQTGSNTNGTGSNYASWTFRKQPKFFDVVTWTGNGTARTIAHNLGSVPGCIIVKGYGNMASIGDVSDWLVYHRSTGNTNVTFLNLTTAATDYGSAAWNSTTPTSTVFSLGTDSNVNANSVQYVAYLFAHDAGGFGLSGTDNVISCGSFTTDGSGLATVSLGYEPQWVLFKQTDGADSWYLNDIMRGMSVSASSNNLSPNLSAAESAGGYDTKPTATGFNANSGIANKNYIYIAIRRGPMKVPTVGTSVFLPQTRTGTGAAATVSNVGFSSDLIIGRNRPVTYGVAWAWTDKLRGTTRWLDSENTGSEQPTTNSVTAFGNTGASYGDDSTTTCFNYGGASVEQFYFQRAPSFFDEVCYTGTGSATTFSHNLAAVPELIITKCRGDAFGWAVYSSAVGNTAALFLETTAIPDTNSAYWNNTTPTSTVFSVGSASRTNRTSLGMVAYLFATCAGVSKVGSYTGTGTTQTINCGFTAGSRFVLIKRTDSTGDWYVWDSARGIVAGNDPYLLLNSTAAEVTSTDYIDTANSGFEISSTAPAAINANGGTFIFLAIA